ncbi:hypothetical protein EVAR_71978_1 [Eumeta japonica]|uniref:Uncharacterized protein n=1 Tax=Eumeta variegata TaxID=151549 RepID=A0A4C1SSM0_EUMVA|nr:hypothetical protein EVAR_71978_1 [Eumeta japonica]
MNNDPTQRGIKPRYGVMPQAAIFIIHLAGIDIVTQESLWDTNPLIPSRSHRGVVPLLDLEGRITNGDKAEPTPPYQISDEATKVSDDLQWACKLFPTDVPNSQPASDRKENVPIKVPSFSDTKGPPESPKQGDVPSGVATQKLVLGKKEYVLLQALLEMIFKRAHCKCTVTNGLSSKVLPQPEAIANLLL